jgi:hypothetical protein
MCMIDDAEPWTFHAQADRKARRHHVCEECRRFIWPGEMYRYESGKCDGYIPSWKTCWHCLEASRWLSRVCNGYLIAAVEEDLRHHMRGEEEGELSSSHLVRLIRWMEADWLDRQGNLRPVEAVHEVVERALAAYEAQHARWLAAAYG